MPNGHLHLERIPTIPQILRDEHSRLLTNEQRRAVSVATHIVGADRQVSALETLDAMDVEARIEDTVFDDAIALTGSHAACTQTLTDALSVMNRKHGMARRGGEIGRLTVPSRLNMPLDPLLDGFDVFLGVLQVLADLVDFAARDHAIFGRLTWLRLDRPAAVLDTGGEVVGSAVGLRILKIQILGSRWRVVREVSGAQSQFSR